MALKVEKIDVWSGELRDQVGELAGKLEALAAAGADLSFVLARRRPDRPGAGEVFLGGLKGAKQTKAAAAAGLVKTSELSALRVDAGNKPGLASHVLGKVAAGGINVRGASATVIGSKCAILLSFDSEDSRDRAVRLLKE
jgi:hypothetical protein